MPGVPAIAETLPGFDINSWTTLTGPAKLPPEIAQKLNAEVNKAVQNPDLRQRLAAGGSEPREARLVVLLHEGGTAEALPARSEKLLGQASEGRAVAFRDQAVGDRLEIAGVARSGVVAVARALLRGHVLRQRLQQDGLDVAGQGLVQRVGCCGVGGHAYFSSASLRSLAFNWLCFFSSSLYCLTA